MLYWLDRIQNNWTIFKFMAFKDYVSKYQGVYLLPFVDPIIIK